MSSDDSGVPRSARRAQAGEMFLVTQAGPDWMDEPCEEIGYTEEGEVVYSAEQLAAMEEFIEKLRVFAATTADVLTRASDGLATMAAGLRSCRQLHEGDRRP
jgi:hypothetical protein